MSGPFAGGYRRIRDRAHAMTNSGRAADVLGHLLGYLNQRLQTGDLPCSAGAAQIRAIYPQWTRCWCSRWPRRP